MAAPGRAFTRLELLERLQGIAIEGVEHTVNTHIHNLRAKIEPDPEQPALYRVGVRGGLPLPGGRMKRPGCRRCAPRGRGQRRRFLRSLTFKLIVAFL